MTLPVSLKAVIAEMDTFSEEFRPYLNQHTGELITLSLEEIHAVEQNDEIDDLPDWQQALIQTAAAVLSSAEYLPLPSKFEIHEYAIMERFCLALGDERLERELRHQMHGAGAFRRFKEHPTAIQPT